MNTPSVTYISRTLLSILFAASLILAPNLVPAQEKEEYTEEEYKEYQDIQAEKDPAKKTDMIVKFLQEKPKSSLRKYITADFNQALNGLRAEKKWSQIIPLGDKFLDVAPGDEFTIGLMAAAYEATGNAKGFATFGEKLYASKPNADLAMEIARSYQKLGNEAKYLQWREKVLASNPDNVEILIDMTQKYYARQNKAQALKYAKLCLAALPKAKKPASVSETAWTNTVSSGYAIAYGVVGSNAYESNNYSAAITNLENAVKYFKRNETAYYFLGLSYWQSGKSGPAMLNFAKAYLMKGSTASSAKKYLDQLSASSRTNINSVLQKAQADLK